MLLQYASHHDIMLLLQVVNDTTNKKIKYTKWDEVFVKKVMGNHVWHLRSINSNHYNGGSKEMGRLKGPG